jgi:UDP-N-acetylglucosamine 3-dehydrogenase
MWLVGAGYWGSKLLTSLKQFNIDACVIDIRDGQTIDDITNTDPVILATPLWQHHEQTVELLKSGHDVYVEKPMAETANQVLDIQQYCDPKQIVMVGHIFVHHPQMQEIKNILAQGRIGQLQHITSRRLNWGIYQTKTDPTLSLATHDISIVLELAGADATVNSVTKYNYSNNVQPDRVMFSGVAGAVSYDIDVSWYWPVRTRETVLIGTTGQIVWNQDSNTVTVVNNRIENNRAIADTAPTELLYSSQLSPLEHELQHWVDCVVNRSQPSTGIDQALAVARVIDQVNSF